VKVVQHRKCRHQIRQDGWGENWELPSRWSSASEGRTRGAGKTCRSALDPSPPSQAAPSLWVAQPSACILHMALLASGPLVLQHGSGQSLQVLVR